MTFPNVPDVTPEITITREESVNLLIASVAFEELGFAHVINAEAEKIQYILGTLGGQLSPKSAPTLEDLLELNCSVRSTLRSVLQNQMLMQLKLEDVLCVSISSTTTSTSTTTTSTTKTTTTTTKHWP